ncbi:hypothetical protein EYZ11_002170 [Aspergillus tanneri]|uniref:Uncharacterized protein n=1 Tax=Aspergillus tanneri TaxID=1220188 RepID=A0A4S3JRB7_9EURO|nr:hypothetical protein EYZ11_002170 [Aspergillus tanneri]
MAQLDDASDVVRHSSYLVLSHATN